ncbi:MAG: hypothetical protein GY708_16900 [Actinomycetia bacterium]|nr:hypothetical protein [Actinomycetes bacterium]MCP4962751.1 hypothetical protein [Actinomycetes bacterium]
MSTPPKPGRNLFPLSPTLSLSAGSDLYADLLDRTISWNQRRIERRVTGFIDHYNTHLIARPLRRAYVIVALRTCACPKLSRVR